MAFTLPNFNLTANILRMAAGTYVPVGTTVCNLAMGRRQAWQEFDVGITNAKAIPVPKPVTLPTPQ